ncbi:MAG: hypothetical protein ACYCOR_02280 [Acidobacteriaceae bacterium]
MAAGEFQKLWWERTFERDREEFTFGDTLDVKTGLILVILIFLAGQSAELFKSSATYFEKCLQLLSSASLIVGGIFAIFELWPREFLQEAEPQDYDERLLLLRKYYSDEPNAEEYALTRAFDERIEAAHKRIMKNSWMNEKKSKLLNTSFYCVLFSLATNLATLAMHLF